MKIKTLNKKSSTVIAAMLFLVLTANVSFKPDEGMYPLSEIRKLDLKAAGLKIDINEVYNPDGISLIDALVNVGGCTGSFVSKDGLIITNHHCSFGAVSRASTTEKNYLENGFKANTREEEIPAQGMISKITVGYEDVSEQILEAANEAKNVSERTDAIRKKIKEITKEAEEKQPGIVAEVSEMFSGQTYILFKYQIFKDVRLVYVPPRNIGEFGGESDNWVWPRHTGDFSFVRAYVAPDGSPAEYSKDNIPFKPKRYLKVNPNGVDEGDFIFILGYPGRTFRHQPSQFLMMQQNYSMPYIQNLYQWLIKLYEERGENDPEFALDFASRIKGLANTEKNYRGKLKGLHRLDLLDKKQKEEKELQKFIENDKQLKEKYGDVLGNIKMVYDEILQLGRVPLFLSQLMRHATSIRLAALLNDYREQFKLSESERPSIFKEDNRKELIKRIDDIYSFFYPELDKKIITKMLLDAASFPEGERLTKLEAFPLEDNTKNRIDENVDNMISNSVINNKEAYKALFEKSEEEIKDFNEPLLQFVAAIEAERKHLEEAGKEREGKLNLLLAEFMDAKKVWLNKAFIPDANGTLRLTYGYVRGYAPSDAVYFKPITTLGGVIEKGEETGDYKLNEKVKELFKKKNFGRFKNEKLNDVPVAILYNTDTSGGNSGSPILNAHGEIIGVNFDRAFEATINDFVWSEDYSRSIGVDIRYVLWVTQKVGGADFLLKEMGVKL